MLPNYEETDSYVNGLLSYFAREIKPPLEENFRL